MVIIAFFGALAVAPVQAQDAAFKASDKNHDGGLDRDEFRAFIDELAKSGKSNAVKIRSTGRYDTAFGRLDKNNDGRVTSDELSSQK